jgi:hypothetical protein
MSIDKKAFGISDSLVNAVTEALKGGQVKLDKNHNGKLDSQDFKMLRKEEVVDEGNPANKAKKNAAVAAVGAKNKDSQYLTRIKPSVADKIRGREKMSGNDRQQFEEVEQVDELSSGVYKSAMNKAAKRAVSDVQGKSGPIHTKYAPMARKFQAKGMEQEKKEKAVKEDIEQVDEISKKLAARYNNKVAREVGKNQNSGGDPAKLLKRKNREAGHKLSWNKYHNYKVKVPATEETLGELSKETLGNYVKSASADVGHKKADAAYSRMSGQDKQADKNTDKARKRLGGIYTAVNKLTKEETDPGFVAEADNAVAKQIAAKKDAFKTQLQQKIAAKQMNTMQAKANKRLSSINASNDKCSCQEGKGKSMTCEVHGEKDKAMKGGKEQIIVNPPMREAAELPKKVITKGHEIAKSLIKHRSKVDNPYAVGMAAAKKSAKMNAYRADRDKHGED